MVRKFLEFSAGYRVSGKKKLLNYAVNPIHTGMVVNDYIYLKIVPDQNAGRVRKAVGNIVAIPIGVLATGAHTQAIIRSLAEGYDFLSGGYESLTSQKSPSGTPDVQTPDSTPTPAEIVPTPEVPLGSDVTDIDSLTNLVEHEGENGKVAHVGGINGAMRADEAIANAYTGTKATNVEFIPEGMGGNFSWGARS